MSHIYTVWNPFLVKDYVDVVKLSNHMLHCFTYSLDLQSAIFFLLLMELFYQA